MARQAATQAEAAARTITDPDDRARADAARALAAAGLDEQAVAAARTITDPARD